MKNISSYFRYFILLFSLVFLSSCVHDDNYNAPGADNKNSCADLKPTMTLTQLKALYKIGNTAGPYIFADNSDAVIEGYVSSSDETGNVYKTLFIQDSPTNPTEGLTITIDAVSSYLTYPKGSKVYVQLKGLALGEYGKTIQLGIKNLDPTNTFTGSVARIPEEILFKQVKTSCTAGISKIVPKVIKLSELTGTAMDQYVGVLVQVNGAEFHKDVLCFPYSPANTSVDRPLTDATSSTKTKVVRNSGYSSFASQTLPSGNGTFIGVLSKFNSTYQFYINKPSDLDMNGKRLDGTIAPCSLDTAAMTTKTVAEVKAMLKGDLSQISGNYYLKAKVTTSDQTGNLYKYFYVEDATGGLRVNLNMTDIYLDPRFAQGKEVLIALDKLYLGNVNGEIQLGGLNGNTVGWTPVTDLYKTFFKTDSPITQIVPTKKTIPTLTTADVGRWIKLENVQFVASDLGKTYADGTTTTNRTLEDCSGNKITLRTSGFADFAGAMLDGGKGDVYGVLSIFNGTYQLWITSRLGADLDGARCDGTMPLSYASIFADSFASTLTNWNGVSVTGAQVWKTQDTGSTGNFYAVMNGFQSGNKENEDWLINKTAVSLSGYSKYFLTFDNDKRYAGNNLEVYISDNYSGNPSTATWTKLNVNLDTDDTKFGWVNSGNVDISSFAGKNVYIGFKYTSTTNAAATWEVDNVKILGAK